MSDPPELPDDPRLRARLGRLAPPVDADDALRSVRALGRRDRIRRRALAVSGAIVAVALLGGVLAIASDDDGKDAERVVAGPTPTSLPDDLAAGRVTPAAEGVVVRAQGSQDWRVIDLQGREIGTVPAAPELDANGEPAWEGPTPNDYDVNHPERPLMIDTYPTLEVVEQWAPAADADGPADCEELLAASRVETTLCREPKEDPESRGPPNLPRSVRMRLSGSAWRQLVGPPSEFLASDPAHSGGPLGSWRWALPSPDGNWVALQWSGECEVPIAFVASTFDDSQHPDGWSAPVANDLSSEAAETFVLGWTTTGEMLVATSSFCGAAIDGTPGIYLVRPGGEPTLLLAGDFLDVHAWAAADQPPPTGDGAVLTPITRDEAEEIAGGRVVDSKLTTAGALDREVSEDESRANHDENAWTWAVVVDTADGWELLSVDAVTGEVGEPTSGDGTAPPWWHDVMDEALPRVCEATGETADPPTPSRLEEPQTYRSGAVRLEPLALDAEPRIDAEHALEALLEFRRSPLPPGHWELLLVSYTADSPVIAYSQEPAYVDHPAWILVGERVQASEHRGGGPLDPDGPPQPAPEPCLYQSSFYAVSAMREGIIQPFSGP